MQTLTLSIDCSLQNQCRGNNGLDKIHLKLTRDTELSQDANVLSRYRSGPAIR